MPTPKKSGPPNISPNTSVVSQGKRDKSGRLVLRAFQSRSPQEMKAIRLKYYQTDVKERLGNVKSPQAKIRFGRKHGFTSPGCARNFEVYKFAKNKITGLRGLSGSENDWICNNLSTPDLRFKEANYRVHNHDIRVFIEGTEVTQHIRGPVNWKIETTGGMNTCDFSLNNNHDAFVLTPRNICAGLNRKGWRAKFQGSRALTQPGRTNRRDAEGAKYNIYRRKYNMVAPGTKSAEIDPSTGMWLYPLSPYTSIIHKHDPIRVFIRLPYISGVTRQRRKKTSQHWDLWVPAFTGFVNTYNWEDNPVEGDRVMNVSCYDYRGLMARMRVRTQASPLKGGAGPNSIEREAFRTILNQNVLKPTEYKKLRALGVVILLESVFVNRRTYRLLTQCGFSSPKGTTSQTPCAKKETAAAAKEVRVIAKKMNGLLAAAEKKLPLLIAAEGKEAKIGNPTGKNIVVTFGKKAGKGKGDVTTLNLMQREVGDGSFSSSNLTTQSDAKEIEREFGETANRKFFSPKVRNILKQIRLLTTGDLLAREALERDKFVDLVSSLDLPSSEKDLLDVKSKGTSSSVSTLNIVGAFRRFSIKRVPSLRKQLTQAVLPLFQSLAATTKKRFGNFFVDPPGTLGNITERNVFAFAKKVAEVLKTLRKAKDITPIVTELNKEFRKLKALDLQAKTRLNDFTANDVSTRRLANKVSEIFRKQQQRRVVAKSQVVGTPTNMAELIQNDATFSAKETRVFGDLVKAMSQHTHPLAGMSFEDAVKWLVTTQSQILPGRFINVTSYAQKGILQEWNRTVLFGDWGRPLTFDEVTLVGINTNSDTQKNPFAPLNAYLHFMLPGAGTAAQTIVQTDVGANPGNAQTFQYETRKSLLDGICELLDYQWYVTPAGDIAFEFPNYSVMPVDYGVQFKNAYVVDKELISNNIAEEAVDIPTAWVITGIESDALAARSVRGGKVVENVFGKIVIKLTTLARRIGVKVEHIKLNLPGVGSLLGPRGGKRAQLGLEVWGAFHIQRQLGLRHQVSVKHAFRPFLLPNRPLHLLSRQRIGLIQSVNYSMEPPDGECTTSTTLGYMRWLFRDGTFRNAAGAKGGRMPINYTGFFSGERTVRVKEGLSNITGKASCPTSIDPDQFNYVRATEDKARSREATAYGVSGALPDTRQLSISRTSAQIGSIAQRPRQIKDNVSGSGGTTAQKGSSLPAGVAPGTPLKTQKPNSTSNLAGRMIRRSPPSSAQPLENLPKWKGSGFTLTGRPNQDQNKKGDGSGDRYDINRLFHDAFPFQRWFKLNNDKQTLKFNAWGIRDQRGGFQRRSLSGTSSKFHHGVDIVCPKKTKIFAPVNIYDLYAKLVIGPGQGDARDRKKKVSPSEWSIVYAVNPQTAPTALALGKKILIWTEPLKINKAHGFRIKTKRSSSPKGLWLHADGYVRLPNSVDDPRFKGDKGRLWCRFRWAHLDSLAKASEGRKSGYYGINIHKAAADPEQKRPIAFVGNSGTSTNHLHFELLIQQHYKIKPNADYIAAYKEVLKANKEYLLQILATKLAGKKFRAKPTDKLSAFWKRKLVRKKDFRVPVLNSKGRRIGSKVITVDINNLTAIDAAKLLSQSTFRHTFKSRTDESFVLRKRKGDFDLRRTHVNPLFFFRPEQLVDKVKLRPYFERYRRAFDPKGGDRFTQTGAGRGRPKTKVVHGICKTLTDGKTTAKEHVIKRAELNRTAGTTAVLLGQSQAQRRSAFRRNNQEFARTERAEFITANEVEDHVYDTRIATRVNMEISRNRHKDGRLSDKLQISPTQLDEDDYSMFS